MAEATVDSHAILGVANMFCGVCRSTLLTELAVNQKGEWIAVGTCSSCKVKVDVPILRAAANVLERTE
jgi:hypothetical protein